VSRVSLIINDFLCFCQTDMVDGEPHDHSSTSKVNLVDLAGSERQQVAKTTGDRLRVSDSYRPLKTYILPCWLKYVKIDIHFNTIEVGGSFLMLYWLVRHALLMSLGTTSTTLRYGV